MELMVLYDHIHEPIAIPKCQEIASKWTIENNYEKFNVSLLPLTFYCQINIFIYYIYLFI